MRAIISTTLLLSLFTLAVEKVNAREKAKPSNGIKEAAQEVVPTLKGSLQIKNIRRHYSEGLNQEVLPEHQRLILSAQDFKLELLSTDKTVILPARINLHLISRNADSQSLMGSCLDTARTSRSDQSALNFELTPRNLSHLAINERQLTRKLFRERMQTYKKEVRNNFLIAKKNKRNKQLTWKKFKLQHFNKGIKIGFYNQASKEAKNLFQKNIYLKSNIRVHLFQAIKGKINFNCH